MVGWAQHLPPSSLAVATEGGWRTWWLAEEAPDRWRAELSTVAAAIRWRTAGPGLELGELELSADGLAWRLKVILVRLDPALHRLRLSSAVREAGLRGDWTVEAAPSEAVAALNAGQFSGGRPWGWVVHGGREIGPPGVGPLSMALVVDRSGSARLVRADSIDSLRSDGEVMEAFQSYPALLRNDGDVPDALAASGRGIDVAHRDSRLALGELRDGKLLLALTRFGVLGDAGGGLPFGPTTPEMAALMGALGCREAVLLDGGLSGQLLVREASGAVRVWKGWRRVPLALLAMPFQLTTGR
jgi:hypothetical protein